TIRWKIVRSKKPVRASATNEATVRGDVFAASRTVNVPQLVTNTAEYVWPLGRSDLGALCPPSCFGAGLFTFVQPAVPDAGAAAGAARAAARSTRSAGFTSSRSAYAR